MENDAIAALRAIKEECVAHLPRNWKTATLSEPQMFYARLAMLMRDVILSLGGSQSSAGDKP